jgi:hypothetical protein
MAAGRCQPRERTDEQRLDRGEQARHAGLDEYQAATRFEDAPRLCERTASVLLERGTIVADEVVQEHHDQGGVAALVGERQLQCASPHEADVMQRRMLGSEQVDRDDLVDDARVVGERTAVADVDEPPRPAQLAVDRRRLRAGRCRWSPTKRRTALRSQ